MNELEKEIELYLSGNMTPEERLNFETKISSDQSLQQDIRTYKQMQSFYDARDWNVTDAKQNIESIKAYQDFLESEKGKDLAATIKNAENNFFEEKKHFKIPKWIPYVGTIAAILLIGFFIFFQLSKETSPISLYAEYKNWEELPSLTLRDQNTALSKAEDLFRNKKYLESLDIFKAYQNQYPEKLNPQILVYTGILQLELNQNTDAENTFIQLQQSNTLDAPKAYWYLALTYLKMKDPEKAKKQLRTIIENPANFNYQKAKELLSKLK